MDWKYVIFNKVFPVLIPPAMTHISMMHLEPLYGKITSAGFIQVESGGIFCYGKSEALGVESGPRDAQIIESHHLFRED